jgi:Tol biopolymer transport system component
VFADGGRLGNRAVEVALHTKYSPDGRRIAFNSDRSGREEIWRCDSNGANLVQLTHFGGKGAGTPRWSTDGRQIAFDSRMYGAGDIFVMDAEGGAPRRLTTEPSHDVMPSWSRDGRQVYFCSDRSGRYEVWKVPAEGGQATQVTWKGGFEAFESADGGFLYYTKGRFPGVWRIELKDGAPIGPETMLPEIRNTGRFRYWVVTKRGVFFVPEEHTSVYTIKFFDFRSGHVVPVFTLEREPVLGPPGLDVSPDGRWILYTQVDQKVSNITLVEGFR